MIDLDKLERLTTHLVERKYVYPEQADAIRALIRLARADVAMDQIEKNGPCDESDGAAKFFQRELNDAFAEHEAALAPFLEATDGEG